MSSLQPGDELPNQRVPDQELWSRAIDLFLTLADKDDESRREELSRLAASEPRLQKAVLDLLAADAASTTAQMLDIPQAAYELLSTEEELPAGSMVGPYRIEGVLGWGGMGKVYRAVHVDYEGTVALKVVSTVLSPAAKRHFAVEKKHLARFNHPNIAHLLYADTLPDGTPYFAMEYVEGQRITGYCSEKNLGLRKRLDLFVQVCGAVQSAHGEGIIHRDLKPSNILVRGDGTVKLLDFGISEEPAAEAPSALKFISLPYAAPEHSEAPAGVRGDIYSLGLLLCEMVTGELPFLTEAATREQLRHNMRRTAWRLPSTILRENVIHPVRKAGRTALADVDQIFLTATAEDPQQRYATVESLARDVALSVQARPLESRQVPWSHRLALYLRRNRGAVSLATAAVLFLSALFVGYTLRLEAARDRAQGEAMHAARVEKFLIKLLEGGGGDAGPSKDMKVVSLLNSGVKEARSLSNDAPLQADLYQTLGLVYQSLGDFTMADQLLRAALEQRTHLFGHDSAETARSLSALARLRTSQRQLSEAERLAREAVGIDQQKLPHNDPETLRAETGLADAYLHEGENRKAVALLEGVVRSESERPEALADLSDALGDLVIAEDNLGHLRTAELLNQQSMSIDRQLVGDQHPDIAADLMNWADFAEQRGSYAEAAVHAEKALSIEEGWFGPDHPEVASALTFLGSAMSLQGQDQQAIPLLQRALTIRERVYGPSSVSPTAQTLNALGTAEMRAGHLAEAESSCQRALAMYRKIYPAGDVSVGVVLSNLSRVLYLRGDYARAEKGLSEALSLEGRTLPATDVRVMTVQLQLGRTLLAEKQYKEAEPILLQSVQSTTTSGDQSRRLHVLACHSLAELQRVLHETTAVSLCTPLPMPRDGEVAPISKQQ